MLDNDSKLQLVNACIENSRWFLNTYAPIADAYTEAQWSFVVGKTKLSDSKTYFEKYQDVEKEYIRRNIEYRKLKFNSLLATPGRK